MSIDSTVRGKLEMDDMEQPRLTGTLNVLTILTIIACIIGILLALMGFFSAQKTYDERDQVLSKIKSDEMPAFAKKMMPDASNYEKMVTAQLNNKVPILILTLLALGLCLFGAIQMRKLKKQGFTFYVAGQILPYITTVIFIGAFMMSGVGFIFMSAITVIFILLYASQRKYLVY